MGKPPSACVANKDQEKGFSVFSLRGNEAKVQKKKKMGSGGGEVMKQCFLASFLSPSAYFTCSIFRAVILCSESHRIACYAA